MRKDIIINANPHEIRIGIREDGELVELLIERADSKRIVGNLYRGVVTSVKPGLQAAFVDIGLERAGFLHASDLVHEDPESVEAVDGPLPAGGGRSGRNAQVPDIGDMLKVGDKILVQVTKEPISSKGPRLTADISLPGRFLVYMPKGHHVGVSRKIEDRRERVRLKRILQEARPDAGAFIVRTAAEEAEEKAIRADVKYLSDLWLTVEAADREVQAPALVHEDVGMVVGLIRDIFKDDVDQLVIDDKEDLSASRSTCRSSRPTSRTASVAPRRVGHLRPLRHRAGDPQEHRAQGVDEERAATSSSSRPRRWSRST
ncbi:MAG: ribonuclease E/G [bacterium]|nr:ribonuclease E/G [bacterium]